MRFFLKLFADLMTLVLFFSQISTVGVKTLLAQCPSLEILKLYKNPQISHQILIEALDQMEETRMSHSRIYY
jgi:hypothetical protein